jgi:hypothetical protein
MRPVHAVNDIHAWVPPRSYLFINLRKIADGDAKVAVSLKRGLSP